MVYPAVLKHVLSSQLGPDTLKLHIIVSKLCLLPCHPGPNHTPFVWSADIGYQVILAGIWASVPASSGVIRGTLLFISLFRILLSLCLVPPPLCSTPSHGFQPIQFVIEVAVEA